MLLRAEGCYSINIEQIEHGRVHIPSCCVHVSFFQVQGENKLNYDHLSVRLQILIGINDQLLQPCSYKKNLNYHQTFGYHGLET